MDVATERHNVPWRFPWRFMLPHGSRDSLVPQPKALICSQCSACPYREGDFHTRKRAPNPNVHPALSKGGSFTWHLLPEAQKALLKIQYPYFADKETAKLLNPNRAAENKSHSSAWHCIGFSFLCVYAMSKRQQELFPHFYQRCYFKRLYFGKYTLLSFRLLYRANWPCQLHGNQSSCTGQARAVPVNKPPRAPARPYWESIAAAAPIGFSRSGEPPPGWAKRSYRKGDDEQNQRWNHSHRQEILVISSYLNAMRSEWKRKVWYNWSQN